MVIVSYSNLHVHVVGATSQIFNRNHFFLCNERGSTFVTGKKKTFNHLCLMDCTSFFMESWKHMILSCNWKIQVFDEGKGVTMIKEKQFKFYYSAMTMQWSFLPEMSWSSSSQMMVAVECGGKAGYKDWSNLLC